MIDIQLLRKDPDAVAKRLATRGFDLNVEEFRELEEVRKKIQTDTEYFQSQRNALSKLIGQAKAKKNQKEVDDLMKQVADFGDRLKQMELENEAVLARQREFVSGLPNIPHESVPVGKSSDDNREERRIGTPRKFEFSPKDHVDVGERLGGLDFATGTKLAGSRFVVMRGAVARLHRSIAQFMLDVHTR